ncbi:MAG: glycosyltransferase family 2 protein [Parasporobacterium sp.]|nr:glycosyltransferase family 2 protein [Parasporobacterium sp.]
MKTIDIVIPVYNEQDAVQGFFKDLSEVCAGLNGYNFRFLFVNDGSKDQTLQTLKTLAESDSRVKYISFSRNFGKEAGIYAGLTHADADMTILMDGDGEHPVSLLPDMIAAVDKEGFEACGAKRHSGFFSRAFTGVNNRLSPVKLQKGATDYMCMSRKFINAVLKLCENQRFTKGLFAWVGFNVKWLDFVPAPRKGGRSKWNFGKLFSYAMDGITSFSTAPLRLFTLIGTCVFALSIIYIIITIIQTIVTGVSVPGYASTLIVLLFLGGLILLAIGICGEYIGRIFMESKNRPLYILDQTNLKEEPQKKDD